MDTLPRDTIMVIDRSAFNFAGLKYVIEKDEKPLGYGACITLLDGEVEKMRDRMDEHHYEWLTESGSVSFWQINFGDDIDDCIGEGSKEIYKLLQTFN
jgi:hypothetical protein